MDRLDSGGHGKTLPQTHGDMERPWLKIKMNLRSINQAIEDEDCHHHVGTPLSEEADHKNKARKEPAQNAYHVNKCALSRVLKGESIMTSNEAPKNSDCEHEETLRHETPTEEISTKPMTSTTTWNEKCTLTKRGVFRPNHTEVCSTS